MTCNIKVFGNGRGFNLREIFDGKIRADSGEGGGD